MYLRVLHGIKTDHFLKITDRSANVMERFM